LQNFNIQFVVSLQRRYPRYSFVAMLTVVILDKLLRPLPARINAVEPAGRILVAPVSVTGFVQK
jgi:hypothetical protein